MPFPSRALDIVVGDGCFNLLRYPDQQDALFRSVERVLSDRGMFLTRAFVRPENRESPHEVLDSLRAGSIGNFHIFKFRLLMALQGHTRFGIRTGDVWDFWAKHGPDPKVLAAESGWPIEEIATIDSYRGQDTHYHFPTFAEQRELLTNVFDEIESYVPTYEMGDRCPTFVLARRAASHINARAA